MSCRTFHRGGDCREERKQSRLRRHLVAMLDVLLVFYSYLGTLAEYSMRRYRERIELTTWPREKYGEEFGAADEDC